MTVSTEDIIFELTKYFPFVQLKVKEMKTYSIKNDGGNQRFYQAVFLLEAT